MDWVIPVASVGVGILLVWGVVRLVVRERRLKKERAPLLGVVYPPVEEDTGERRRRERRLRRRNEMDRDTE